ncbi:MAG: acyl-CoA dehydrogenase [Burkholderiaceae bacterium]|nr:acyl-CoA dehydrogenase [Burkholderiaceae bacterium]
MADYNAPVRDMQFVVNELIPLSEITALPGYEEAGEDLVNAILEEAAKFANGVLAPLNWVGDQEGCVYKENTVTTPKGFKDAYQQFSEAGWIGLGCDPDYGGQGLPALVSTAVCEMWHASNMAFTLCPMLTAGAIDAISHHGSAEQKTTYLPNLISGKWAGTMNLTEPNAGSDLSVVSAKAIPQADGTYKITGTKIFITYGEHDFTENIIHLVLARLPDAPPGVKGISLFIVPKFMVNADGSLGARNDVKCISLEHKLGIHASPTAVMSYGESGGATGYLVGQANRGLEYMFTMMNAARLQVGLEGVGISERAYQQAASYALQRVQGKIVGKSGNLPIAHHPDISRMLMTMRAQIQAMRALAFLAAAESDRALRHPDAEQRALAQARLDLLIPIVKGWSTEQSVEITSLGVQIHGGMGFVEETGAAQHFRDARITPIYEGTTGIQANDLIGRKISRDGGKEARRLIEEIKATATQMQSSSDMRLKAMGSSLGTAALALDRAVEWVVETMAKNSSAALAGAYPLMKCFGVVAGGWLLARSALIAMEKIGQGSTDEFYTQKIGVALFYAHHILTAAAGLSQSVRVGEEVVAAMNDGLNDLLSA